MRYLTFTIDQYRGIKTPLTVNIRRKSLIPIVGVNECGKTTILEALLSFDSYSDTQNGGHHLQDLHNLYSLSDSEPRVSATVKLDKKDWLSLIDASLPSLTDTELNLLRKYSGKPESDATDLLLSPEIKVSASMAESEAGVVQNVAEKQKAFQVLTDIKSYRSD